MVEKYNDVTVDYSTGFLATEICAACGGKCCKRLPGAVYPSDIEPTTAGAIATLLKTGKYVVDWWEGDPRGLSWDNPDRVDVGYFIRPATVGCTRIEDPSWGGICTFLGTRGCKLEFGSRPLGCRMLEPRADKDCECHGFDKLHATMAWLPYHKQIEEAVELCS